MKDIRCRAVRYAGCDSLDSARKKRGRKGKKGRTYDVGENGRTFNLKHATERGKAMANAKSRHLPKTVLRRNGCSKSLRAMGEGEGIGREKTTAKHASTTSQEIKSKARGDIPNDDRAQKNPKAGPCSGWRKQDKS